MIDKDKLQHEVHELFREHLDFNNVGRLKTEIVSLCTRYADEAREEAAKIVFEMPNPKDTTDGIDVTDPWQGGYERARVDAITAIRSSKGEKGDG